MRVLVINVNSHSGSTGKITKGLYDYLRKHGHEVKVLYRGVRESRVDNPDFIPLTNKIVLRLSVFFSRLTGLEGHFSYLATHKAIHELEYFRPDIVQAYNLHGNYINSYSFLTYLKRNNFPVVYSMLDEYPYMGKCPYPVDCDKFMTECNNCPQRREYPSSWLIDQSQRLFHKKEKIYNGFDQITFTGPPYACQRANSSYLLRDMRIVELDEPVSFAQFYPRDTTRLRKELGIREGEKVVLCASGPASRKGGHFFMEAAKRLNEEIDIRFVFIGYTNRGWDIPNYVILKGYISDPNELAEYMSLADAYVCPSVGDTTPSVCLCAMGCGTPLIGFDYGGVKDCAPVPYGTYVPMKDVDAMATAIKIIQKKTAQDIKKIREYAIGRFSQESVYSKQLDLYTKIMSER